MSIRVVVVMVRVIRGHGLLAIMTDDLSSHIQEAEALLLQCCWDTNTPAQSVNTEQTRREWPKYLRWLTLIHTQEAPVKLIHRITA